nr:probable RNA-binding protein CG14230 [Osmia lignaria]
MLVLNDTNEEIKMVEVNESEKKRLKSLQDMKQAFRTKELIVQNALKDLDKNSNKNKIIFDEDINEEEQTETKGKVKKRKRDLFDNDDNDDNNEFIWDNDKFKVKANKSRMFPGCNFSAGTDERFKLDMRFMEDDHVSDENAITQKDDETDLKKEKELQLDILENILGVPYTSKNKSATTESKVAKKGMVRYDPTKENHKEYEINTWKVNIPKKEVQKKQKVKKNTEDTIENPPVEVSKDIYFSVSESLTKSLREGGGFNLLNKYGNKQNNEKEDNDYNATPIEPSQPPKFQLDFKSKNPFKYDSTDDEHDNKELYGNNEQHINEEFQDTNKFFFDANDTRFSEAVNFFSKEYVPDDTFKNLRYELKQIMRSKIRNNIKRAQPFGRKKSIKRLSKKVH